MLAYPLGAIPPAAWAVVLVSGVLETSYVFALAAAHGAGDLSLVYPVARGVAPVVVAPLAVLFLGERLSALGGIGLVVVGIFWSHGALTGGWSAARAHRRAFGLATRELSIVVAALLGVLVLRERHSAVRLAGAVTIFAGLGVIALAR